MVDFLSHFHGWILFEYRERGFGAVFVFISRRLVQKKSLLKHVKAQQSQGKDPDFHVEGTRGKHIHCYIGYKGIELVVDFASEVSQ